ncbi:hypothetical protein DYB34_005430 [Aphanomyces astaci]|uniref:Scavenger mRNA-decapping enzyme DcpS n=2 Tax=Aphanomyces astaci TaxID=112090 RepID=A0A397FCB1_APHAT|nr:hypothetical protein DYB34_005430 [Aphanomyces astaci]RHZ17671.1 hypothetical protein DYB31_002523 [Aphanomyces astaci]
MAAGTRKLMFHDTTNASLGDPTSPFVVATLCVLASSCIYVLQSRRRKQPSAVDLTTFQLEDITKAMDSELCVVGTFPGSPDKVLLVLQKQKFGRGDALGLIHGLTLRRTHENDVYSNHIGVLSGDNDALRVTMIYPATAAHIAKHTEQRFYMAVETQAVYEDITLPYIESIPTDKIQWVYNILERYYRYSIYRPRYGDVDGIRTSETDKLLLEDRDAKTGFVLLPDTKWNAPYHVEGLYCLAIVMDRSIRSVRDLRALHVPLLENLRAKSLALIWEKYGVAASSIRCFVHYQPSYYHFHVHFTHVKVAFGTCAILIEDILFNLSVQSDYYERATLSYLVGSSQHGAFFQSLVNANVITL